MASTLTKHLSSLLASGKISQTDAKALIGLHLDDLSTAANSNDIFAVRLAGNIAISCTVTRSGMEAVSKVFHTAELIEAILSELPKIDLLIRANRVCKGFQAAIESSLKLQRKLFRAPDHIISPLEPHFLYGRLANKGLEEMRVSDNFYVEDVVLEGFNGVAFQVDYNNKFGGNTNFWKRAKSSSLGKAFVTQPPSTQLIALNYESGEPLDYAENAKLSVEGGITFLHLLDWLAAALSLAEVLAPEFDHKADYRSILRFAFYDEVAEEEMEIDGPTAQVED